MGTLKVGTGNDHDRSFEGTQILVWAGQ
jgi:hypothetical protein